MKTKTFVEYEITQDEFMNKLGLKGKKVELVICYDKTVTVRILQ